MSVILDRGAQMFIQDASGLWIPLVMLTDLRIEPPRHPMCANSNRLEAVRSGQADVTYTTTSTGPPVSISIEGMIQASRDLGLPDELARIQPPIEDNSLDLAATQTHNRYLSDPQVSDERLRALRHEAQGNKRQLGKIGDVLIEAWGDGRSDTPAPTLRLYPLRGPRFHRNVEAEIALRHTRLYQEA